MQGLTLYLLKCRVEDRKCLFSSAQERGRAAELSCAELCSLARLQVEVLSQPSPATSSVSITFWFLGKVPFWSIARKSLHCCSFFGESLIRRGEKKKRKRVPTDLGWSIFVWPLLKPLLCTFQADCHLHPKIALLDSQSPMRVLPHLTSSYSKPCCAIKAALNSKVGCKVSAKTQGKHPASMPGGFL